MKVSQAGNWFLPSCTLHIISAYFGLGLFINIASCGYRLTFFYAGGLIILTAVSHCEIYQLPTSMADLHK